MTLMIDNVCTRMCLGPAERGRREKTAAVHKSDAEFSQALHSIFGADDLTMLPQILFAGGSDRLGGTELGKG